jgi:hypothetical protein
LNRFIEPILYLSGPISKYGSILAVVFYHRKGAEGAGSYDFLVAAERPANKKTQALRAKYEFDPRNDIKT